MNQPNRSVSQSPLPGLFGLPVPRPWQAYIIAILATTATLGVRLALDGELEGQPTLVIFTLPIMLSAYVGGLRAGLLATAFSSVLATYFLLASLHTFAVTSSAERWQQIFVLLSGVVVSVLSEGFHRARREVDRANIEREHVEMALRGAEALQNAIFKSANFSSIATDTQGVIQIFNVGAERMLGYTANEVVNRMTPAAMHDWVEIEARAVALSAEFDVPISPGFETIAFKASRGIEDVYDLTKIRKDGSSFPAAVSVTALRDAQGVIIGYLLIGTDNTARWQVEDARKRMETALRETNVKLDAARQVAEKASRAKSEFLSSMSHELRSPLNAILGFAQLMESTSPAPTGMHAKNVAQILKAGWYLLQLINEILDLAAIESGNVVLAKEVVSLAELTAECRGMMETQAYQRNIRMTFAQFDGALVVVADRTRLKQIVINLLSNAIKYNRDHGEVVVICAAVDPTRIRISVRDTGEGLSGEKLALLFSPFNRLGQEAGVIAGTGIGLVVSKRLAESMGGSIGVASEVGIGSEFWCDLPAVVDSDYVSGGDARGVDTHSSRDVPRLGALHAEGSPA